MNCKPLIFLLCFNLAYLSLFHSADCLRFVRGFPVSVHRTKPIRFEVREQRAMARQMPFMPSVFSGPLALATFLFALPLLPSLVMAPLALAGIPPALNVLSTFMSSLTNGRPLGSILSALSDPLSASADSSSSDNQQNEVGKPSGGLTAQIDTLKSIARMFRAAISRRNIVNKIVEQESAPVDKVPEELEGLEPTLNATTTTSTNTSVPLTAAEMEKSIRTMDAVVTSIRDVYSVIRHGLRRYEITDSDCQSRIVCEIHQKVISRNKMLKTFSLGAIDALSLEKQIDSWNTLNDKSKRTIKYYINAAKVGFADKDCLKEFENCPTLNTRSPMLKDFGRYLFGKL